MKEKQRDSLKKCASKLHTKAMFKIIIRKVLKEQLKRCNERDNKK